MEMPLALTGVPTIDAHLASTATGTPQRVPVSSGLDGWPNGVSYSTSLASSTPRDRGSENPEPPIIPI